MSRYETYKPSGIDWIGEVPTHWQLKRIKDVSIKILGGGTPDTGNEDYWDWDKETGIPWVAIADITKSAVIKDTEKFITHQGLQNSSAQLIDEGKILYSIYASLGKVAISGRKLATNQAILSIYENPQRINVNFLKYYLINLEEIVAGSGSSTTQNNISLEKLRTFKIAFPEISEQIHIANYLDDQTQKIDRLIANKKAQAEKLKELRQIEINNAVTKGLNPNTEMKDSGIEWLGKIPKHWEVKRLKNVADINSTKQELNYEQVKDREVVFLAMESVSENGQIDNSEKRPVSELWEGFTYFQKNDVIIAKITPCFENGKGAWLNNLESDFGFGSTEFHTVRGHKNRLDNHYFYHVTKSDVFMKIGEAFMTGSAGQKRVSTNFVLTFKLAFPPIMEQIEIANYLQQRTTAIDQLIKNIEAQIEKLQELRKIKIYEAVTGKIKVNAYAETTA